MSKGSSKQRLFLIIAVAAAVLSTAGLVASLFIKSPAQLQSEQAPPAPSVLTAKVTSQRLAQTVTVRGTVESAATVAVRALSADGDGLRVVTATPKNVGDTISSGQMLLEISGRPLIIFAGAQPAYRDLVSGLSGPDAKQVQQGLVVTGDLAASRVSGTFDSATQRALSALYKRLGYATNGTGSSVSLPLSELAFVPQLPATLATLTAQLGAPISGTDPIATLNTGALQVATTLAQGQQVGVVVGQKVNLSDDVSGRQAGGVVTSVGAYSAGTATNTNGSSQQGQGSSGQSSTDQTSSTPAGYPVLVTPDPPLSSDWLGANIRLQIVGAQTSGNVLVVPSAAITSDDAGGNAVVVLAADGSKNTVPVRTGMTVSGLVEVTPTTAGALKVGDRVVTG